MPGLSSPSFLSTSCPAAPSRPPPSTCSADFWTPSMDTLLEPLIKVTDPSSQPAFRPRQPSVPFSGLLRTSGRAATREAEGFVPRISVERNRMASFPSRRDLSFAVAKNFLTGCGVARLDMAVLEVSVRENAFTRGFLGGCCVPGTRKRGSRSHVSRENGEGRRIVSAGPINFF